jgi:16S rRNA (adenine1518-N6/adenine1519-N6)-dimethyltransferase
MSTGSSSNQTLSFLKRRFAEAGIRLRTKLGQNFLVDLNLVRLLVETADLGPEDLVLEVGTGTGSLTALVAQKAAAVVTVEVDRDLFNLAAEALHQLANVTMLRLDALKNKNRLHPAVLEAVGKELAAAPGRHLKLVANLPYNVATPVLTNILASDTPPCLMAVTIQKEVADRLAARPGTKDYGALSIWVQSQCRVEVVRVMGPSVFWPRPKVSSAIVRIVLDEARQARIPDREYFHQFIRAVFRHRRKFLRSELTSATAGRLDKPGADRVLARLGLDGRLRAENLDVPTMLALAEAVRGEVGS